MKPRNGLRQRKRSPFHAEKQKTKPEPAKSPKPTHRLYRVVGDLPRFVIDEAIAKIKDGTITGFVYDKKTAKLVQATG